MSYCVNCGVELEKSQKRCPLCSTPVINPYEKNETAAIPPYPYDNVVTVVKKLRRTAVLLITIILFVPFILCPLCDFMISGKFTWSRYVMISIMLGWIYIIPPIVLRHNVILKCAWIDYFSTLLFLYTLNLTVTPMKDWFAEISLPILSYLMAVVLIYAVLIRNFNIGKTIYVSLGFAFIGVMSVLTEYILNSFNNSSVGIEWSLPVIISCLSISLLLLIISRMSHLKANLKKRMHI